MPNRTALLASLCLLLAAASPALAQSESAKSYFDKATAAFALNKYADAAANYERAFELKPDPALLYDAAQAHRLAGNKPRALALYQNYLRIYGRQIPNRAEVERHVTELQEAIEQDRRVAASPPTSTTPPRSNIETEPPPPSSAAEPKLTPSPPATSEPAASGVVKSEPAPKEDRPLIKKPWFWAVVGGGAIAVALGVGLGVGLSGSASNPSPTFGRATGN